MNLDQAMSESLALSGAGGGLWPGLRAGVGWTGPGPRRRTWSRDLLRGWSPQLGDLATRRAPPARSVLGVAREAPLRRATKQGVPGRGRSWGQTERGAGRARRGQGSPLQGRGARSAGTSLGSSGLSAAGALLEKKVDMDKRGLGVTDYNGMVTKPLGCRPPISKESSVDRPAFLDKV